MQPKRLLASAIYKEWYPFDNLFEEGIAARVPDDLNGCAALVLWGGEDISPSIYGQHAPNMVRSGPATPSYRDQVEVSLAKAAIEKGIPIIGVCRGAQLMCALSGGTLYQHVTDHAGKAHTIMTDDGREVVANSVHHQMMNMGTVDHKRIGWVEPGISKMYIGEKGEQPKPGYDLEIAYIPKTKALCIQGHPEFLHIDSPFTRYCLELVEHYVLNKTPGG